MYTAESRSDDFPMDESDADSLKCMYLILLLLWIIAVFEEEPCAIPLLSEFDKRTKLFVRISST